MKILREDDEIVRRASNREEEVTVRCLKKCSNMRTNILNTMSAELSTVLFLQTQTDVLQEGPCSFPLVI